MKKQLGQIIFSTVPLSVSTQRTRDADRNNRDPGSSAITVGGFPPQYELPIKLGIVLMFPGVHFCYSKSCKKMLAMFLRKEQILLVGTCANTVLMDSTKLCYVHLPCSILPRQFQSCFRLYVCYLWSICSFKKLIHIEKKFLLHPSWLQESIITQILQTFSDAKKYFSLVPSRLCLNIYISHGSITYP